MNNPTELLKIFGVTPGQAAAFGGSMRSGVTAAGANSAAATVVAQDMVFVSTAAAGTGVRFSKAERGRVVFVSNGGANAVLVYPPTGGTLNGGATDAGVSVGVNKAAIFVFRDELNGAGLVGA